MKKIINFDSRPVYSALKPGPADLEEARRALKKHGVLERDPLRDTCVEYDALVSSGEAMIRPGNWDESRQVWTRRYYALDSLIGSA